MRGMLFVIVTLSVCSTAGMNMELNNKLLLAAAQKEQPLYLQELIHQGADVNAANEKGKTPLISAASEGLKANLQTLLDNKADPNSVCFYRCVNGFHTSSFDIYHDAPYMIYSSASEEWRQDVFSYRCMNVLSVVGEHGSKDCMELLLKHMKNPFIYKHTQTWPENLPGNSVGEVALLFSIKNDHKECARMLLEYAKQVDLAMVSKNTLISYFVSLPDCEYKQALCKHIKLCLMCNKTLGSKILPKPIFFNMIIKKGIDPYFGLLQTLFEPKNLRLSVFTHDTIFQLTKDENMGLLLQEYKDLFCKQKEHGFFNFITSTIKNFRKSIHNKK